MYWNYEPVTLDEILQKEGYKYVESAEIGQDVILDARDKIS